MCNFSSFATDHLLLQLVAEAKATNSLLERVLERMQWKDVPLPERSSLAGEAVTERRKLNGPLDRRKADYKIMTPEPTPKTPRIGIVATPNHVGVRTWQQLDCPKCRQRITVDVTEAVSQATRSDASNRI